MYPGITAVILAGGKSSRMGTNKSFLKIGQQTMIERTVELLRPIFPTILISTNSPNSFSFLSLRCIPDIVPNAGPLSGIHSGLVHATTQKIFVISCDMPLMSADVIEFLVRHSPNQSITVAAADGFVQQLCGVYDKNILSSAEQLLKERESANGSGPKQCSVLSLLEKLSIIPLDFGIHYQGNNRQAFYNMNNPDEYRFASQQLAGGPGQSP